MSHRCSICCNTYKSVHYCNGCDNAICRACARHIVNDYGDTALGEYSVCVHCNRPLTIHARQKLLGITFMNVNLRLLRQQRFYLRQERLFGETLPLVERERRRRALKSRLRYVRDRMREGQYPHDGELTRLHRALANLNTNNFQREEVEAPSRCSAEGCDGYLSKDGECHVCHRTICLVCGCPSHVGRVCDAQVLASMSLIKAKCRPCVRCSAPSMRTEGCPVMWCVKCHTFWHWDSMTIIEARGQIPHNPDHREWLQRNGGVAREIGDIPCGGLPTGDELHTALIRDFAATHVLSPFAEHLLNAADAVHLAQRMRAQYPVTWNEAQLTESLRVAFLLGDLNAARFSQRLERTLRLAEYKKEIGEILTTFVYAAADIFQRLCSIPTDLTCDAAAMSMAAVRDILNEAMASAHRDHGRSVPVLTDEWVWVSPYRRLH